MELRLRICTKNTPVCRGVDDLGKILIATSGKREEALKSVIVRLAEGLDIRKVIVSTTKASANKAESIANKDNDVQSMLYRYRSRLR